MRTGPGLSAGRKLGRDCVCLPVATGAECDAVVCVPQRRVPLGLVNPDWAALGQNRSKRKEVVNMKRIFKGRLCAALLAPAVIAPQNGLSPLSVSGKSPNDLCRFHLFPLQALGGSSGLRAPALQYVVDGGEIDTKVGGYVSDLIAREITTVDCLFAVLGYPLPVSPGTPLRLRTLKNPGMLRPKALANIFGFSPSE